MLFGNRQRLPVTNEEPALLILSILDIGNRGDIYK